ncbi:MAG: hypothetical protein ACKOAG_09870 [Candidatus Kapaibacterium sp.]
MEDASTAVVAVEPSSFTSAFAEAPFMEQQLFLADALLMQQAPEALPLHFPSASQAETGAQYAANSVTTANNAMNFFIKTSKIGEKTTTKHGLCVAQYIYRRCTEQCIFL